MPATFVGLLGPGAAGAVTATNDLALALPVGSGEANVPLGTGAEAFYDVELRNLGPASPDGTLTLSLPAGVQLGPEGVALYPNLAALMEGTLSSVPCVGTTGTVTCTLGSVPNTGATTDPKILEVDLLASTGASAAAPGTTAPVSLGITSSATDTNPANNAVSSTIDFTGQADLSFSVTPVGPDLGVGRSTTLTLSVTNHGPQTAGNAVAIVLLEPGSHFAITNFDGASTPGPSSAMSRSSARKAELRAVPRAARTSLPRGVPLGDAVGPLPTEGQLWFIGNIASGDTITSHLTLRANSAGTTQLVMFAGSDAADPDCVGDNATCAPALDALTAVPQQTAAYIASSRISSAVYINGLVKQYTPTGIIRSVGRTVYLQRYLNGTWQNVLARPTGPTGQMAVGFIQTHAFIYRLYVAPSTTARAVLSGLTIH